jgi:hypothetical protein
VLSANIHRRHLTTEQKRELIAKLIKQTPNKSDRQIAKQTKTSPTTVGKIRKETENAGDVSKVDTRTDTKGRKQPSAKPKSAKPTTPAKNQPIGSSSVPTSSPEHRMTASPEISIEERRAQNALLDQPGEEILDEAARRVSFVLNTILHHAEGLRRSEAKRFFVILRDGLDEIERKALRDAIDANGAGVAP